jgi:hypothetical protein
MAYSCIILYHTGTVKQTVFALDEFHQSRFAADEKKNKKKTKKKIPQ